jgi:prolyl-tRNA synthetase
MIGTLIMAHSDDDGLVLPPRVATQQIVILPVSPKEETREAVFAACQDLAASLRKQVFHGEALRVHVDTRDLNGGVKKWEWIKKGVPIRIEIGPRDLESGKVCVQRRDQPIAHKEFMARDEFVAGAVATLDEIHHSLLTRATAFRDANIAACATLDAFHAHWASENPGWLCTHWAGTPEEEERLSKQHKITIRCLPLDRVELPAHALQDLCGKCILTGKETAVRAIWGRSY